jgi:hypothetical protein
MAGIYPEANEEVLKQVGNKLQIKYLLEAYKQFPDKGEFFIKAKNAEGKPADYFFNKLAGNATLMQQIKKVNLKRDKR